MAYRSAYSHGHTKFDRRILAGFSLLVLCACDRTLTLSVGSTARCGCVLSLSLCCCICECCVWLPTFNAENPSRHTIVHGRAVIFSSFGHRHRDRSANRKEIRLLLVIKWFLLLLLIIHFFPFLLDLLVCSLDPTRSLHISLPLCVFI